MFRIYLALGRYSVNGIFLKQFEQGIYALVFNNFGGLLVWAIIFYLKYSQRSVVKLFALKH